MSLQSGAAECHFVREATLIDSSVVEIRKATLGHNVLSGCGIEMAEGAGFEPAGLLRLSQEQFVEGLPALLIPLLSPQLAQMVQQGGPPRNEADA